VYTITQKTQNPNKPKRCSRLVDVGRTIPQSLDRRKYAAKTAIQYRGAKRVRNFVEFAKVTVWLFINPLCGMVILPIA
jgi:hypothetical protein